MPDENGWSAYEKLVLSEIKDLKEAQGKTDEKVQRISESLVALKIKQGILSSMVGGAAGLLAHYFGGGHK